MSDVIINVELDEGVTITSTPDDNVVINLIDEAPVIINMCDDNGIAHTDYAALTGKPKINTVELVGNKTSSDLKLEPERGVDDFYITNAEKTQGALATGVAALPTVKDVAEKTNRLLVDFKVPTDTPSLEFLYTDGGVLLSSLALKRVILSGKFITDIAAGGSERLSINGDNTNTYASAASSAVIGGFRFPVYKLTGFDAVLSITNNSCVLSGSVHASQNTVIVNTNTLTNVSLSGLKDGATTINSIKIERLNNVFVFKAGSTIKIYRND